MDRRHYSHDTGSSRSARDDSRRTNEDRSERDRGDRDRGGARPPRSRSRSPRRRHSPDSRSMDRRDRHRGRSSDRSSGNDYDSKSRRSPKRSSEELVPPPPPPPRITKISIGFSKPSSTKVAPIKMSLGGPSRAPVAKPTVASVFNSDDDEEPEEMPAEARMRMRNIGRETPTSAGPNSFGKTKQGFCDAKKVFEKNLKQALEMDEQPKMPSKFPQTIYKLKGP